MNEQRSESFDVYEIGYWTEFLEWMHRNVQTIIVIHEFIRLQCSWSLWLCEMKFFCQSQFFVYGIIESTECEAAHMQYETYGMGTNANGTSTPTPFHLLWCLCNIQCHELGQMQVFLRKLVLHSIHCFFFRSLAQKEKRKQTRKKISYLIKCLYLNINTRSTAISLSSGKYAAVWRFSSVDHFKIENPDPDTQAHASRLSWPNRIHESNGEMKEFQKEEKFQNQIIVAMKHACKKQTQKMRNGYGVTIARKSQWRQAFL